MKVPFLLATTWVVVALGDDTRGGFNNFGGGLGFPVGGHGGRPGGGHGGRPGIGQVGGIVGGIVEGLVGAHGGGHGGGGVYGCGDSVPTQQRYGCRYFTKDRYGQYVCDRNQKPSSKCPPVRPTCTRFSSGGPPAPCVTDNDCYGSDKCCCDACLDEPVCKPAS